MKVLSQPPRALRIVLALAVVAACLLGLKPALRWLDTEYLHEALRDWAGRHVRHEDWSTLAPLPSLNDQWLKASAGPRGYRIAHALGAADGPDANTLAAFAQSRLQGFQLFEVDLSLDQAGRLRCHHGPAAPPSFDPEWSCTFERLLAQLPPASNWLVLDLKTDFRKTAERVLEISRHLGRSSQLVFQLYTPDDYSWFQSRAVQHDLPAPLITAYLSRRSLPYLYSESRRLGVPVLTVPAGRLAVLDERLPAKAPLVFTHPVHSCRDWQALAHPENIRGIYTLSRADLSTCMR